VNHRLKTAIARLKREIAALEALPEPRKKDYAKEQYYKRAITLRKHAIAWRHTKIKEYEERCDD